MSPARRLQFKKTDQEPETTEIPRDDQRVRLNQEVLEYLKISPVVLVPTLKTSLTTRAKSKQQQQEQRNDVHVRTEKAVEKFEKEKESLEMKNKNDGKKPLQNGQLYRLPDPVPVPVTKMSVVNGITQRIEKLKQRDFREDDSKQGTFLSALNLVDTSTAERIAQHARDAELAPSLNQKLRSRKGQVVSFFRNNPVPISSKLGKQIVIKSGIGKCPSPKDEVARYEKYCSSYKQRNLNLNPTTTWPQVNLRKSKLKPDQYCHTYTYGKRQRIKRDVELVVGLSTQSFPLLNSCRDASVKVYRMTDSDLAKAMFQIQSGQSVPKVKKLNNVQPQLRWVASEPCAGPSRGIEIIAEPVVKLYDIRLSPSKSDYFH